MPISRDRLGPIYMKFDPLKSPGDMIDLYTAATPNGWKVSIAFEEMELPYNPIVLKLSERKQHEEWFYQMNPNGRIPVIVDHDLEGLTIFETGAIMLASDAGDSGYATITLENEIYMYWSLGGYPSTYSDTGQALFLNCIDYLTNL